MANHSFFYYIEQRILCYILVQNSTRLQQEINAISIGIRQATLNLVLNSNTSYIATHLSSRLQTYTIIPALLSYVDINATELIVHRLEKYLSPWNANV